MLKLNDEVLSSAEVNNNSISLLPSQLKNSHKSTGLLVGDVVNEFTTDNKFSQGFNIPSILNLCKSVFKKLSILVTLGRTSNNLEKSIYCSALKFNDEILVIFVKGNNLPVESVLISNRSRISYLSDSVFVIFVYSSLSIFGSFIVKIKLLRLVIRYDTFSKQSFETFKSPRFINASHFNVFSGTLYLSPPGRLNK